MANPDGYVHTWWDTNNITTRLWRKNKNTKFINKSLKFGSLGVRGDRSKCHGVDLNRNFDFHWNETRGGKICSNTWPGPKPFSEAETQNIRDYLMNLRPVPILTLALHSAAELILFPYSYSTLKHPKNIKEIKALAHEAADALYQVHSTRFRVKEMGEAYPASGTSADWYKGVLKSRFTYTIELRRGKQHRTRWILPKEEIIPSGEEMWAALSVMFKKMMDLSY